MNTDRKWSLLRAWLQNAVSNQLEAYEQETDEHPGSEDMLLYATAMESYKDVLKYMDALDH